MGVCIECGRSCRPKAKDVVFKTMYNTHILKFPTWDSFRSDGSHIVLLAEVQIMSDARTRGGLGCRNGPGRIKSSPCDWRPDCYKFHTHTHTHTHIHTHTSPLHLRPLANSATMITLLPFLHCCLEDETARKRIGH